MSTTLFATVLLGTLFVVSMVGLSRLDVHASAYAADGSGAGSAGGYGATVDRIESRLTERSVFRGLAGVTVLLTVVLLVLLTDAIFELAGFATGFSGGIFLALFGLVGVLLFVSTYAWTKRLELGTAHGLAAALFVVGMLFILLVAVDLMLALTR